MKSVIEKIQIDNKNKDKIQMRRGDEGEREEIELVRGGGEGSTGAQCCRDPIPVATVAATAGLRAQAIASPLSDGEREREYSK